MICTKGHSKHVLSALEAKGIPRSQKNVTRHLCAACSFEAGYLEGLRQAKAVVGHQLVDAEAEFTGFAGEESSNG